MPVPLKTLLQETENRYKMTVLAGCQSLEQPISWVHITEMDDVDGFVPQGALVFTTGARRVGCQWIESYCRALQEAGAAGLVLNLRPGQNNVPESAAAYCDRAGFPLIVTPWESSLAEITQIYGKLLILAEQSAQRLNTLLMELLLHPEQQSFLLGELAQNGYGSGFFYTLLMVAVGGDASGQGLPPRLQYLPAAEQLCKQLAPRQNIGALAYGDKLALVLPELEQADAVSLAQQLAARLGGAEGGITVVVGPRQKGLENFRRQYELTDRTLKLGLNLGASCLEYDALGLYKILLACSDYQEMRHFAGDYLGRLVEYDRANCTDYLGFLRRYFAEDFSLKEMAQTEHMHRNTVYYHLSKISDILGLDLNDHQTRVCLAVSFRLLDILKGGSFAL